MRKFILKSIPFLILIYGTLFLYFYVRWNNGHCGDLGRLGFIIFDKDYHSNTQKPQFKSLNVISFNDSICLKDSFMVASIGDSFSEQGVNGYQNYLAHYNGSDILDFSVISGDSPERVALHYLKNGTLKKNGVKIVIIESVERAFVKRLLSLNENLNINSDYIPIQTHKSKFSDYLSFLKYFITSEQEKPVQKHKININAFSYPAESNILYYYSKDEEDERTSDYNVKKALNNLDLMHKEFEKQNISMIYLLAADKYDVYKPFISENISNKYNCIDYVNLNSHNSYLVNSRDILRSMVKSGVRDVYKADDSHWSYIAADTIAKIISTKNMN